MSNKKKKKIFFRFLADFVILIIANYVLDNWVRAEVILGVNSSVVAYGFILFLVLYFNHIFLYTLLLRLINKAVYATPHFF